MFFIGSREKLTSSSFLMHMLPAGAVLVTMLGLSFLSWRNSMEAFKTERDTLTTNFAKEAEKKLSERLNSHNLIITGATGLFTASNTVSSQEWATYLDKYDLPKNYTSIHGVGFAKYARQTSELAAMAAASKNDGIKNFRITPAGVRSEYAINYFFEPGSLFSNGYDLMTDPRLSDSLRRAASTGEVVMTGKQKFSANGQSERTGYFMILALFSGGTTRNTPIEKRAVQGFAYMPVIAQNFFNANVGNAPNQQAGVRVYDTLESDENLLYESSNFTTISDKDHYSQKITMQQYGRTWILDFRFNPAIISETTRNRPLNSAIAGVLLSLLLSGFVLTLLAARSRALSHSQELEVQNVKDELLSLASHQLRTPATSVKQYVGMILEGFAGNVPKRQRDLLTKAYESNERQLHIINELLYVAKIDSKGIVLTPRKLNLNKLIQEVVQDFLPVAKPNKQKIVLDLPKRIVFAEADEHCLRMALENLVNNALKYSHPGRAVSIKLVAKKNEVQIAVKDRGIGIAEQDLPLLFKQFSRIPNEFSVKSSGSGIGLYLAKQLINLHGGEIYVESQHGNGTTFTIHLPKTQSQIPLS